MYIAMRTAKRMLATTWFTAVGLIVIFQIIQSSFGQFGSRVTEAWGWLLPHVLPSSTLIFGVLKAESGKDSDRRITDKYVFQLALGLSCFHLLALSLTMLLQEAGEQNVVDFLKQSDLWLGPTQALATAALGVFFVQQTTRGDGD